MWKDNGLQLVMLPTKEETSLIIDDNSRTLHKLDNPKEAAWGFQQLYLLSDEEIKEGDWCCKKDVKGWVFKWVDTTNDWYDNSKKIIATTDPSLNLPCFPSSFLEEYVKRYNSKKSLEVKVEYTKEGRWNWGGSDPICDVWILNSEDNTISIRFKEEKKYSRSEVEELCRKAFDAGEAYRTGSCEGFKQIHPDKHDWIKENLK